MVQPDASSLTSGDRLIAGGLAEGVTLSLTYPLEFIRSRLPVQTEDKYRSLSHAFSAPPKLTNCEICEGLRRIEIF